MWAATRGSAPCRRRATGLGATINDTTTTLAGTDVYILDAFGR
jgi:hypothetical protein